MSIIRLFFIYKSFVTNENEIIIYGILRHFQILNNDTAVYPSVCLSPLCHALLIALIIILLYIVIHFPIRMPMYAVIYCIIMYYCS